MSNYIMLMVSTLPIVAILNLIMNQSHLLMNLLSLEGIMLTMVLLIPMSMSICNAPNSSLSVILLTFGACEASLGLSLMVMMSRSYGNDMLKILTMNKC